MWNSDMERILALTEDTELIEEIRNRILEHHLIDVDSCSNSLDFLENFQKHHIQLAILDIDLLKGQIIKMIKFLRSIKRDCQIILILSKLNMVLCSRALSFGVVSYFIRPVSVFNAAKIICSALDMQIHNYES